MKKGKIREQKWFPNAVALSIAVVLYVALSHLNVIGKGIAAVFHVLYPVIAGVIIAYLVDPLMKFLERKVFRNVKNEGVRKYASLIISILVFLLFIVLFMTILIPQLYSSITRFISVLNTYIGNIDSVMGKTGFSGIGSIPVISNLLTSSQDLFDALAKLISDHVPQITNAATSIGGHLASWGIGAIIAVYLLADKERVKGFLKTALKQLARGHYSEYRVFFGKSHAIISRYIVCSIIEAFIVAAVNAVIMKIFGMSYIGLVSLVVGVTNLIPTFGPIIGAVIGAFVLLLVKPLHALIFILFTIVLQLLDGYVFKPKFFGDTFGVSGIWILISTVIAGRIAGMAGIILAIPTVAIVDLAIKTWKNLHPSADVNREIQESENEETAEDSIGTQVSENEETVTAPEEPDGGGPEEKD